MREIYKAAAAIVAASNIADAAVAAANAALDCYTNEGIELNCTE